MKYTGFSLLIHLFVLIATTACSDEAIIGDESSTDKDRKIMLSLPPSEVVEVRAAVDIKETYIHNAYVLIFSAGRDTPYVESILQITGNGNSTSPALILQRNSPAPGDLVYVLCNVSYQGDDPDNFSDITRDNIDEKFPLTVSEELDFSDTGLPMMGKIDKWPESESASPTCEMHFAVAKIRVSCVFYTAYTEEISFTVHNYVKRGNISYSPSGLNAVDASDPTLYVKESKKITLYKEGERNSPNSTVYFYLFEYPSATSAMGKQVDEKSFSVDRPCLLFEKKLKSGEIEYSRYDLYKGEVFIDLSRQKLYQLNYRGQLGYDTKEMAMAVSNNILYDDWEISDDWSSVIKNGPYAILTNKNAIAPTIEPEITLDLELNTSNQFDISSMPRKILLRGSHLDKTNIEEIVCIDKETSMEYKLTPFEDPPYDFGYKFPLEAVSRPLSLSIRLKQPWWDMGKNNYSLWIDFQFGYLERRIHFSPLEAANCYLAVGKGEDINIWLGQANQDGKGYRIGSTDQVTAEVLWKDNPDLQVEFKIDKGLINMKSLSSPEEVGNMVIVAKVNDRIRWSWHVWYPGADVVIYNKEKGFYEYRSEYTKLLDGSISMDRNLGALANYPNKEGKDVKGLYYQWERKDPFPDTWREGGVSKEIYNKDGESIFAPFDVRKLPSDSSDGNLEKSIEHPLQAYGNNSNSPYDWWAVSKDEMRNAMFWDKSYDPCPIGWRVPSYDVDRNYLEGIPYDSTIDGYQGDTYGYFPLGSIWMRFHRWTDVESVSFLSFSAQQFRRSHTFRYNKYHIRCIREN